jgi:hypothetical protein
LLVIYDEVVNTSRLVEVATGNVLLESPGRHTLQFSPQAHLVTAYNTEGQIREIFRANDGYSISELTGGVIVFSPDESLAMAYHQGEITHVHFTRVIETAAGTIVGDFSGRGQAFSPDNTLLATVDTDSMATYVFQLATGEIVAEIPSFRGRDDALDIINAEFTPDGSAMAVYQMQVNTTYFFNTDNWDLRFQLQGPVIFNRDGSLLVANNQRGPANVLLANAATGEIISQFFGRMAFARDSSLLIRSQTASNVRGGVQLVDPATGEVLAEQTGFVAAYPKANDTILQVFDNDTRNTKFFDIERDVSIEVAGYANLYSFDRNLVLSEGGFTGSSATYLADFESGDVYATAFQIHFAPNGQYTFASDGQLVDVYGLLSARLKTMPPPRPDGGIASAPPGEIAVHSAPNTPDAVTESSLTPFYFYVIGQNPEHHWLYVIFYDLSSGTRHIEGWIRAENFEVIEPWDDAPVLDPADPLGSLRAIAEARAS